MSKDTVELDCYIVRHGQTFSNIMKGYGKAEGLSLADREDPVLTDMGLHEARLLGERFASFPFDAVLSSGMRRTLMTANEVVKRQNAAGAKEIEIYPMLTECGISYDYDGFSLDFFKEKYPVKMAEGISSDKLIVCSAGKDDDWQFDRANKVWEYIHGRFHSGEKILLSAHGSFNTALFLSALKLRPGLGFDVAYTNTGVTRLVFFKEGTGPFGDDIHVAYHNDASHLYNDYPELGFFEI